MRSASSGCADGTGEAALTADRTGEWTLTHGDWGRLGSGLLVSGIAVMMVAPETGTPAGLCKSGIVAAR